MQKYFNKCTKFIKKNKLLFIVILIGIILLYVNLNSDELKSNDFSKYLENKRVIIVGPADYVKKGKFIDSFDVIVRVNKGHNMIKNPLSYGSRTDILYHCAEQSEINGGPIPNDKNIKFIKFTFPKNNIYGGGEKLDQIKMKNNYKIVDEDKFIDFEKKIKTMPNAGTTAIWDLLNYNIKSLHITGFTMFQTNYNKLYREKAYGQSINTGEAALKAMTKSDNHDQKNIANYYLQDVITDNRITYDKEFIDGINKTLSN
tara:strand:- start:410 stop:1183 length:774 start_codon:yes stop_codon:yes gene_type:complete